MPCSLCSLFDSTAVNGFISQPFVKSFAMDSREVPLLILCLLPGLLGALCTVGAAMLLVWVCAAVVRSEATDDEGWVRKAQRVRRSHV